MASSVEAVPSDPVEREASSPQPAAEPKLKGTAATLPRRNMAVDAYRGLVMLLMMGEVMQFATVAKAYPKSLFWHILAFNQTHVQWSGMGLHDTIQPGFTFLVGVALPYSVANRMKKRGQSFGRLLMHTLWRSALLVWLGIWLRSIYSTQTYFTFEDTLTQIGLGYTFCFLLAFCKPKWQWTALGAILFGYWLAWALYPAPGANFNWAAVGVPQNWAYNFHGFAAHWNKNSNLGQAFDVWFLNLFPRTSPFVYNDGGYLTLSFIPTLGTMLLGLFAGQWFREAEPKIPVKKFVIAGFALLAAGALLHVTGICPIVKRIWTPSWTLWSGGVCFLFLAAFSWIIDVKGFRKWSFPLVVVGMNSIAAYMIAHLWEDFILKDLHITFGYKVFQVFGMGLEPLMVGISVMICYWAVLYWMWRNRVFIRI